jgi:hypothetical protein
MSVFGGVVLGGCIGFALGIGAVILYLGVFL